MQILFITSTRIGDAILSTGLLAFVAQKYPQAKVTIACGELVVDLFEGYPLLDQIIPLRKKPLHGHWIELWKQVVGTSWDLVIDLRDSMASRLLRAKQHRTMGMHIDKTLHKVAQNGAVMSLFRDAVPPPQLWFSDDQLRRAHAMIKPEKSPGSP